MIPWARSERERTNIELAAAEIAGESLDRVAYLVPGTSDVTKRRHYNSFDEVDMGVELTTVSGSKFCFMWVMDDVKEGLRLGRAEPGSRPVPFKRLDVSSEPEWAELRGKTTTGVALAWHRPCDEALEAVWSVRLRFDRTSVVIALGEAAHDRQTICYIPDSLVVIFDEVVARSYEPLSSQGSSWGGLITPD